MLPIKQYFSVNKEEKTAEWGNLIVRNIRQSWNPLVSSDTAQLGMSYLLSYQDMDFIKELFKDTARINLTNENDRSRGGLVDNMRRPVQSNNRQDDLIKKEMRSLNFKALPIWEKLRNVIVAEMKKMGTVVNVRSEDPTSVAKRLIDKGLIEHKNEIEGLLSYVYTSIGQQPYKLKEHKARFGEKPDNGNTEQFEAMGLNPGDPADVDFFMKEFHKLDMEISMQDAIDFVASYNQWLLDIEKWVNDLIAKKAIAATCYVSNVTGAIMTKYLAPETVFIYGGGNRQDFNDAGAKGYERKVSIKELLEIIGNEFDMEKEFNKLLQAITFTEKIEFTDVHPDYRGFVGGNELKSKSGKPYSYNDFLTFRVTLGRIEFTSQNQETFEEVKSEAEGFFEDNQPKEKYPTKSRFETPTYKAYYLAVSSIDQILFDFGELEYRDIAGACDFNMNYTIITYKDVGNPLAIQSIEMIDMINEAWYKFRYELRKAQPRGRVYNYDAIITAVMDMIPDTNSSTFNKFQKVMEMTDSSANVIFSYPEIDGKKQLVSIDQVFKDIPGGMSEESMLWWKTMMDGISYLKEMIGIAPLREGDPGGNRDSMNNQFKALESSQESTYYIPDMLTYLFQQMSVKANFFAQDIIQYKKYNTVAYRFLEDALGSETIDKLEGLGNIAPHRFGIFVESLNLSQLRQKLDVLLDKAVQNGAITIAQMLLIGDIKNVKKAIATLAYFEQRNKKMADDSAQKAQQAQQQQQQQMMQMQMAIEQKKIDGMILGKQIDANAGQQEHLINQQGGITKTKMKIDGDIQQLYHQAMADFMAQQQKLNESPSAPPPPPPPVMHQQQQGGGASPLLPPQQTQEGSAQNLRAAVQPSSTSASVG
jgi:hypothetical protein